MGGIDRIDTPGWIVNYPLDETGIGFEKCWGPVFIFPSAVKPRCKYWDKFT